MKASIIYLTRSLAEPDSPAPWEVALRSAGFDIVRSKSVDQAIFFTKSYSPAGVLIDLHKELDAHVADLQALAASEHLESLPLIGIDEQGLAPDALAALAEAGLAGCHQPQSPPAFLTATLEISGLAQSLKVYKDTGMNAEELALKTRKHLHDFSQPLAALSGRLQIALSKCDDDDPMKPKLAQMVQLIMDSTKYLQAIQQLQREYSPNQR